VKKSIRNILILFFLILIAGNSFCQTEIDKIFPPSPAVASLMKYNDIPVSYYTGIPDISIPIFNAKGRILEAPITLSYHAGGNRVEEIPKWVGLGWNMIAGGVIARTVKY
jgi:hypothetical protein